MMWSVTVQGTIQDSNNSIEWTRKNFSFILSQSQSAEEFATKMKALARNARDNIEWDHGRCDFHLPQVRSCGKCEDEEDLKCDGKDYHTKYLLIFPFHSLTYEIECHERTNGRNVGSLHSEEGSF